MAKKAKASPENGVSEVVDEVVCNVSFAPLCFWQSVQVFHIFLDHSLHVMPPKCFCMRLIVL